MYINSYCSISAAGILDNKMQELQIPTGDILISKEPSYNDVIPPMQLRRMSKTLRTGVAAAKMCLQQINLKNPSAIAIGTAYGVLDDSEKFLDGMIAQQEQTLTPTAFIQSTHNTVSGQIALAINCNAHNMTFVHGAHSFESALLDADLFLDDHPEAQVLVGAVDEITVTSNKVLERFEIYNDKIRGGEAATFFVCSKQKTENSIAELVSYKMFTSNDDDKINAIIEDFLNEPDFIDLKEVHLISDYDTEMGLLHQKIEDRYSISISTDSYKKYCGEFPTASAFGLAYSINKMMLHPIKQALLVSSFGKCWSIYLIKYCQ